MKSTNETCGPLFQIKSCASLPIFLFLIISCGPSGTDEGVTRITEIERSWAETAVTGDTSVIKTILADDFLGTNPDGIQYSKKTFIKDLIANPLGFKANVLNNIKVRFFDGAAVAQGDETFTLITGESARFVWTDVLVRRDGNWQIVAAQDVIAPVEVPTSEDGLFTSPLKRDVAEIDSCRSRYVSAWLDANPKEVTNIYIEDGVVLYPNQPAIKGRADIESFFSDFFREFAIDEFALVSDEVVVNGDWAFDRGIYKWRARSKKANTRMEDIGKYLVILQRGHDGLWRVTRDMDNSDRPLSQSARGTN
jgi:uncharacterized protein (TIGR02246 family)